MHAAQAAPTAATGRAQVNSYRDLLEPIPNASEALKADDARIAAEATEQQPVQLAQFVYHHHHHHHHGYFRVVPGPYPRYYHHHHHHHHRGGFGIYIR
jgi:hypothetical protein